MATFKHIRRRDYGGSAAENVETTQDTLSLAREIYQGLSDVQRMKSLTRPTEIRTEFDKFITMMDDYSLGNITPSEAEIAINEYLGSLGLTEEYPFIQDTFVADNWMDPEAQDAIRNVSLLDENLDPTDNIVDNEDNVVHLTGV